MDIQIAAMAAPRRRRPALSVHGARHDAYAFEACDLTALLDLAQI